MASSADTSAQYRRLAVPSNLAGPGPVPEPLPLLPTLPVSASSLSKLIIETQHGGKDRIYFSVKKTETY